MVLYRPFRVGDRVRVSSPRGEVLATVEVISLGYTVLRDDDGHEVVVPNAVMAGSVLVRLGRVQQARDQSHA